ncbi:malonyl-CoA decarboxylase [Polaromonas sp.]|uniref:malonyl-CoA decarboxylase n=1 Tax=Polaromonas sp. TaxID=1869339 RepID=UPI003BB5205A
MNSSNWIGRNVSRLLPAASAKQKDADTQLARAQAAGKSGAQAAPKEKGSPALRSIPLRLEAALRQEGEALSPRLLRRALQALQAIIDPRVSEVEGGRRAMDVAAWYADAPLAQRRDLWLLMSEQFVADAEKTMEALARFAAAVGTPDEAVAEVHYRRATVSPRRRLLQRFSVYPEGVRFLVDLRAEMLPFLKADRRLMALDVELEYMFSTWFDVGFLDLRRISWDSPASLIEKLIQYEAVHDIRSWADVKNRLDSDRRCYGFFHPRLPGIPLIFVEVALVGEMAQSIEPLLDEHAAASDLNKATTAIFYSISNTQSGLRGVSFGDSLIKRVVETLKNEFPRLKVFATLSPIPGLRSWLGKNAAALLDQLADKERRALGQAIGSDPLTPGDFLAAIESPLELPEKSPLRRMLLRCAAHYLGQGLQDGKPLDAVARFHLGNGARVERLNWAADPSPKGLKQSCGLMVNYLYDLKRLDKHRALLAQGKVPVSMELQDLYI